MLQHADATRLDISVQYGIDQLRMQIEDNGVGLSGGQAEAAPGHFGVIGMRERTQAIGGTFTMTSVPAEGTKITVVLPLK